MTSVVKGGRAMFHGVAKYVRLTRGGNCMYIHIMLETRIERLFPLPCACQGLRRLTRMVTRIYDQELHHADIEITQFGLLTALAQVGETNQKTLSAGLAMDSTTLTRTLGLLRKRGWISVRPGQDRRERLFRLTDAGQRQIAKAHPHWQTAERRLRELLGDTAWTQMQTNLTRCTRAAAAA
jgi:DNA-binding MarR family transcriptional regulator